MKRDFECYSRVICYFVLYFDEKRFCDIGRSCMKSVNNVRNVLWIRISFCSVVFIGFVVVKIVFLIVNMFCLRKKEEYILYNILEVWEKKIFLISKGL